MDKLEFPGKLDEIAPGKIIDISNQNDFENFFLILAMIFNDLKGLIFFQKFIEDHYRKPEAKEITPHAGEYNGLMTQTNKLLISTINEFFVFLRKNKNITSNVGFILFIKKLSKEAQSDWSRMVYPEKDHTSIISKLSRIRSNVSSHFDHSAGELKKGFIRSFFDEGKDYPQHKIACFSVGNDMKTTRYYYADAAVEEYIESLLDKEDMELVFKEIERMNLAIQQILRVYINSISQEKGLKYLK